METKEILLFIENERKQKSLFKTNLCKLADVDYTTYWRYLNGSIEPQFDAIIRLLKALGLNICIMKENEQQITYFKTNP